MNVVCVSQRGDETDEYINVIFFGFFFFGFFFELRRLMHAVVVMHYDVLLV